MNRYKHITFNPHLRSIQSVIDSLGATPIWALHHIIPITEWERVAVFETWDEFAEEDKEFGRVPLEDTNLQNKLS